MVDHGQARFPAPARIGLKASVEIDRELVRPATKQFEK
jgi:hypothetical protein